ncbi:MAG TPA: SOS response-associated peptidase [Acidimicrobiales bacterium]|nr:SOS response-associated peptidase [Acidimicrobiales bacterium]
MCGRIAQSEPSRYAQRLKSLVDPELDWHPSWNIGPTAPVLGVRERHGELVLSEFAWGLLPGWVDDPKVAARAFNARAESAATKPMFRQAFERRRLLVPVDGFYEWAAVPGSSRKQPYFFQRADGDPVVLAGLWEYWARGDDRRRTAAVLTSKAGTDMPVHDRQPVVLEPEDWARWLDPELGHDELLRALLEPKEGVLVHHPVTPDVGSVRNDGPHLVEAVAAMPGAPA